MISHFFIDRPIFATVLSIVITLAGGIAVFSLPTAQYPLLRVYGVSDISLLGGLTYSMRAWLDPQKLASLSLNASDVATAVANQNLAAAPGQIGQPPSGRRQAFDLPLDTLGRLTDPEQFGDIILKVSTPVPTTRTTAKPPGS